MKTKDAIKINKRTGQAWSFDFQRNMWIEIITAPTFDPTKPYTVETNRNSN